MEEGDLSIYTSDACNNWVEIKYRPIWFIPWYRTLRVIDIKEYQECIITDQGAALPGDTRYQLVDTNKMENGSYNIGENAKIIMDGIEYKINPKTFPFIISNFRNLKSLNTLN